MYNYFIFVYIHWAFLPVCFLVPKTHTCVHKHEAINPMCVC